MYNEIKNVKAFINCSSYIIDKLEKGHSNFICNTIGDYMFDVGASHDLTFVKETNFYLEYKKYLWNEYKKGYLSGAEIELLEQKPWFDQEIVTSKGDLIGWSCSWFGGSFEGRRKRINFLEDIIIKLDGTMSDWRKESGLIKSWRNK